MSDIDLDHVLDALVTATDGATRIVTVDGATRIRVSAATIDLDQLTHALNNPEEEQP